MLEIMPQSQGDFLAMKASGKLNDDDYQKVLIPAMEKIIAESGQARVLLVFAGDFQGWDLKGLWDDVAFGARHRHDFRRLAVVGAWKWIEWATRLEAAFMRGEVKVFASEQAARAEEWARA